MYKWITRHPQVVQSPISNDCLKVLFDDQTEPQLVPKFLHQVSVRELHNSLVSDPNTVYMKSSLVKKPSARQQPNVVLLHQNPDAKP